MNDSTSESNKTLLIVISAILGVLVLVLAAVLFYILLPSQTAKTTELLSESYRLESDPPDVPDDWVSTSSSRFYVKHPPGISASKITGDDRKILGGIVHDKGEIELALEFSNEKTELFDLVVGDRADITPEELFQKVRNHKNPSGRDSSPSDYRFERIKQGDRDMLRFVEMREGELAHIELWSANQFGDFLWIQTTGSIGKGVDWMLTPDQARKIMSTVRGP